MEEMELAIDAATTPAVKMWMNWMMIIFLLSIVFVWKHKAARYVLGVIIISMPLAIIIFSVTKSPHLIGIAHIIVWSPLAILLVLKEIRNSDFKFKSAYGIWLVLLIATIAVSLVFDVRDITLVMLGLK